MKDLENLKKHSFASIVQARVPELEQDGSEYKCCCPFHKEDTPSFTVYETDAGVWLYKCHGCGASGNVFQFVMKFDRIGFNEAVEKVKSEFEWDDEKETVDATFRPAVSDDKKFRVYPLSVLEKPTQILCGSVGEEWLKNRGISLETALDLSVGFVRDLSAVSPNHPWVADGWVLIPYIRGGKVVCIKYRSVMGKRTPDGKKSGILRAPDMDTMLYNLDCVTPFDDVWLVEGEMDVMALTQVGLSAVGLPTDKYVITPKERDVLTRANRIFLAGDMDPVGREAMVKLWRELRDRTYLVEWPSGCKDANDALKSVDYDEKRFQELTEQVQAKALERPIPDFYDVSATMENMDDTNPMDDPRRLHMRYTHIDEMAITLPGNVVSIFATYTGSGKTTWCLDNFELEEAMHGRVVLNYSAELTPEEFGRLVCANILEKNRLQLSRDDFREAARRLREVGAQFYVGYNADLTRIGQVLDAIEAAIRRIGAHIIVLDHLHFLCRGERDDIKAQADAMQRIKNIAVKYGVIFVVVGQSRKAQPNRNTRPSEASDAKGSETFMSDATTCYHIHRQMKRDIDWTNPPFDLLDNRTEIRLYKARTKGPGKAVALQTFDGARGKFYTFSGQEPPACEN